VATANTTGTIIAGTNTMGSGGSYNANYAGRIGIHTGETNADWLASLVTGTTGVQTLGPNSTQFAGQSLDNISGPNFWAPALTVVVNDGSSNQHSQVSELTLFFDEPVNIVNLLTDFQVKDANGNVLSINVTDPNTGVTTVGATGPVPDTGATMLVITFNLNTGAAAGDTYAYGTTGGTPNADVFGNSIALTNGNFFLNTKVADITNNGIALDGAHNGVGGSTTQGTGNLNGNGVNEIDEFWRLFGDANGTRFVDALDAHIFGTTEGSVLNAVSDSVVSASSSPTGLITLTTTAQNGFQQGEQVAISGVMISGNANNPYNGNFFIQSVTLNTNGTTTITYQALSVPSAAADANTGALSTVPYLWYLDFNQDGNIDVGNTLDSAPFFNDRFGINGGIHHLLP
jgi:hypothetical protein